MYNYHRSKTATDWETKVESFPKYFNDNSYLTILVISMKYQLVLNLYSYLSFYFPQWLNYIHIWWLSRLITVYIYFWLVQKSINIKLWYGTSFSWNLFGAHVFETTFLSIHQHMQQNPPDKDTLWVHQCHIFMAPTPLNSYLWISQVFVSYIRLYLDPCSLWMYSFHLENNSILYSSLYMTSSQNRCILSVKNNLIYTYM